MQFNVRFWITVVAARRKHGLVLLAASRVKNVGSRPLEK